MTGVGSRISRANLPSMYWQQHKIKHEALKWYNLNWGRLEKLLFPQGRRQVSVIPSNRGPVCKRSDSK
jgi:hypothetical protein